MSLRLPARGHKATWSGTCGIIVVDVQAGVQIEADADNPVGVVGGTAIRFGQVGWPMGFWGPTAVEAGAATNALIAKSGSSVRDISLLVAHNSAAVLAGTGEGTLKVSIDGDSLVYRGELDLVDPEALSAYRKIATNRFKAASIGYGILDGEYRNAVDNSVDSITGEEETEIFFASEIEIYEISVLAHGAFTDATTSVVASADGSMTIAGQRYVVADEEKKIESSEAAAVSEGTEQLTLAEARSELYQIGVI